MKLTEEIVKKEEIYKGKIITLNVIEAKLENGKIAKREIVEHSGGVCVISIDENNDVLMVKQFRMPFREVLLEVPAGKLDYGEDHLEGGKREFLEETGYTASEMIYVGEFFPSVGFLTERIHIYIAKGLEKASQKLDDDEFLNVEKYNINTLYDMVMNNEIKDSKTIIAIFHLKQRLENL